MPVITVTNKTSSDVPVNSYFGTLVGGRSKTVELTSYQLDLSKDQLVALAAAGLVVWSVASTASTADDAAESVTIGQLTDGSLVASVASPLAVGAAMVMAGAGSPESVVTGPVGALFMRTDGGAGTTLYVKESGTGNTGWVAK